MIAQDYLEQLQRAYRRFDYLVEILFDRRDIMLGRELNDEDDDTPRHARELASHTLDRLFTDLPDETRAQLKAELSSQIAGKSPQHGWAQRHHSDFLNRASDAKAIFDTLDLAVGELESASFNASAIPVPGAESAYVIALNKGLSLLVYEVARTVAGTYNVPMGSESSEPVDLLTQERAARVLFEKLNCYLHLGIPYGDECEVSQQQIIIASMVTTMAERFAYLHEISHIILGHLSGAPLVALEGDWSDARHTTHESEQEHEADILAWNMLAGMFVRNMSELQMAYAGSSLLLSVSGILEEANDVAAVGTHPPAIRRKAYLDEAVKGTLNEFGVPFEQASMIERAMIDRLKSVRAKMAVLPGECPFGAILDQAASPWIPDYMSFQSMVLSLLSHSAPNKLCRAMGYALGRAETELGELGWLTETESEGSNPHRGTIDDARAPFNKFKLVRGLVGLYLIPEISRFIERYRKEYLEGK
jgi:hypothetical protein